MSLFPLYLNHFLINQVNFLEEFKELFFGWNIEALDLQNAEELFLGSSFDSISCV